MPGLCWEGAPEQRFRRGSAMLDIPAQCTNPTTTVNRGNGPLLPNLGVTTVGAFGARHFSRRPGPVGTTVAPSDLAVGGPKTTAEDWIIPWRSPAPSDGEQVWNTR
ncbi:hypothetical protein GCM10027073_56590 [Streptomyces chlorus]